MEWLVPSITATLVATMILCLTYLYLYSIERNGYLLVWGVSWGLYALRFACMLGYAFDPSSVLLVLNQSSAVWSGLLLLIGSRMFAGRRLRAGLLAGLALLLNAWIVAAITAGWSFLAMALPTFLLVGGAYVWTGLVILRHVKTVHVEKTVTGIVFILWGLHKMDYPFLRPLPELAPWGYLLGAVLAFLAALSVILLYLRMTRDSGAENEERFRALVDTVGEGIILQAASGEILHWNSTASRVFGVKPDRIMGKNPVGREWRTVREDGSPFPGREHPSTHTLRTGEPCQDVVMGVERPDGVLSWIKINTRPMFTEGSSRPSAVVISFSDITERVRDMAALKESEERFRLLFTEALDPILVADAETGVIRECNKAAERFFGLPRQRLIGLPQKELHLDADDDDHLTRDFRHHLKNPLSVREVSIVTAGNRARIVSIQGSPVILDGRKHLMGVFRDVTENRLAVEAVRRSEAELRRAQHRARLGSWEYDVRTGGNRWSSGMYALMGYRPGEVEPTFAFNVKRTLHPDNPDVFDRVLQRLSNGARGAEFVYKVVRKNGSVAWMKSFAELETDGRGEPVRIRGTTQDVTEAKVAERELVAARDAAEAGSRAKSEFLANMSHEIRTPLNGILGMLQLIQTADMTPEYREYADVAYHSAKRLTGLLSDILDLSRVEAGKLTLRAESMSLSETVRQVCELFGPASKQSGLELSHSVDPEIPERLVGDSSRLQQVLNNLVGNALKFTPKGGVALKVQSLRCGVNGRCRVLFSVSDTGIGMPDDKIALLFESFTQGSEGYSRKYQGAGLGLTICKQLVGLMGGVMCVESEVDRGTTVHISLPFGRSAG